MPGLIIFGASTFARQAHYYAVRDLERAVSAFVVDEGFKTEETFQSLPVWTWSEFSARFGPSEMDVFVAIGYRRVGQRAAAYEKVRDAGYQQINIICRSSFIADDVVMGDNNIVMPGVVIEPGVVIGSNNVCWSNATICHDGTIGDHNFIASGTTLGGHVSIGNRNFLGFSSVVNQNVRIGNDTLVGAQTLVNRDTRDLSKYWGVPARRSASIDPLAGVSIDD